MVMQFEITQASKGLKIISQNEQYYFTSKLFSHSSTLINQNAKIIGTLKRRSWWRMKFDLNVDGKCYQLCQGPLTTELFYQKTGVQFFDLGGGDFFKKNTRVTEFEKNNVNSKKFHLVIRDEEHFLALLIAVCLEYNPHINDSGNF